jgi:hypothetical protein
MGGELPNEILVKTTSVKLLERFFSAIFSESLNESASSKLRLI